MLPSKTNQMKASYLTACYADTGFGHALLPSCLCTQPKIAFVSTPVGGIFITCARQAY